MNHDLVLLALRLLAGMLEGFLLRVGSVADARCAPSFRVAQPLLCGTT